MADNEFDIIYKEGGMFVDGIAKQKLLDQRKQTTYNHVLRKSDAEEIFELNNNGNFKNLKLLGETEAYGNDQVIFETKRKYNYFFVDKGSSPNKVTKNRDNILVSVYKNHNEKYYSSGRPHMIGDKTNKQRQEDFK